MREEGLPDARAVCEADTEEEDLIRSKKHKQLSIPIMIKLNNNLKRKNMHS